jgi:hypothetical protein
MSENCKIIEFTKIIDLFNIRIHDKNIKYFNKYESIGAEFNFISNKNYTKSFGPHKFNLNYLIKNTFLFKKKLLYGEFSYRQERGKRKRI